MQTTITKSRQEYEKTLLEIVRALPLERLPQVIEIARAIGSQNDEELEEEETEEEIAASEAKWDELFARPEAQAKMLEMAQEALAQADAGLAVDMEFDDEGNLIIPEEIKQRARKLSSK